MNRVELIGRLTKDIELRYTQNGKAVGTFTLAIDRIPDSNGKKQTDFINIIIWDKLAENANKYVFKGSLVAVEGRIGTRSFDSQNGQKKYVTEVICERIQFLDSKKKEQTGFKAEEVDGFAEELPW
jgi:single-strand DNA-binding protein